VHKQSRITRAIKKLAKKKLLHEEEQTLLSEMTILKHLDHPNILNIFELFQDRFYYYLVSE